VSGPASYTLHHHPLDPSSRRVRLALAEKGVACELIVEKPWEPTEELLSLNPSGELPVLVITENKDRDVLADPQAISEYLDETTAAESLLGKDPLMRAEVRRLIGWFERKFYTEVTLPLVGEKGFKRLMGTGEPDSFKIRAACQNIRGHLDYIAWLTERRNWLAGDAISFADLAAGAQLSVIDYLGDVPWDQHVLAKEWYARLKSRPSFRSLLGDRIAGFLPPKHYADLDF
jgi:glutathione S-transferase